MERRKSAPIRAVLPSTSASCYASIHTGVKLQTHGCTGNNVVSTLCSQIYFQQLLKQVVPTVLLHIRSGVSFFHRSPFEPVRDIEYDEPDGPIHHSRFHTMTGYGAANQMTPADCDLFASLSNLCRRFDLDYGILHTCTLDSMGHRFGHDFTEMDHACFVMNKQLAPYIKILREMGYQIIVTADHGQTDRGHHGGSTVLMRDAPLYYFGPAIASNPELALGQLQLAPTKLSLLGADIPDTMKAEVFLKTA